MFIAAETSGSGKGRRVSSEHGDEVQAGVRAKEEFRRGMEIVVASEGKEDGRRQMSAACRQSGT